jgi:hypothetical protein
MISRSGFNMIKLWSMQTLQEIADKQLLQI